jgi:hypothetical protein
VARMSALKEGVEVAHLLSRTVALVRVVEGSLRLGALVFQFLPLPSSLSWWSG